jgi:hypothetical protein
MPVFLCCSQIFFINSPIVAVEWLAFLIHIWEVLDSNLALEIGYPDRFFVVFLSFSMRMF